MSYICTEPLSLGFRNVLFLIAPSGAPDNITATAVTSTAILVMWDLPLPQFRNGPILAYNLTVTDTTTGMVVQSSIVLTTSTIVYSLRPFTTYNFTLSAHTSVGYGPNDTVSEITLQDSKLQVAITLAVCIIHRLVLQIILQPKFVKTT